MPKPPLNHMMLHEDTLADEFDAILGYRTSHAGIVLPGGFTSSGNKMLVIGDSIAGLHAYSVFGSVTALTLDGSSEMTVTWTSHGLVPGGEVFGFYANEEDYNGRYTVTSVVDANNFKVALHDGVATSGSVTAKGANFLGLKQQLLDDRGSINWLTSLNGACFDIVGVHSEGGSLTTYLDDLMAQTTVAGTEYDWVTIISGVNDAASWSSTPADGSAEALVANITAVSDSLRAAGKGVIISTIGPWGSGHASYSADRYTEVKVANALLRAYAAATDGVFIMDAFAAGSDGDPDGAGVPASNILSDNLHPTQLGAYTYAKRFMADNPGILPAETDLLPTTAAQDINVTPAILQHWRNPMFSGTGGTKTALSGSPPTGTVPDYQSVVSFGAAMSSVASIVAGNSGIGNAIRIDGTFTANNDQLFVYLTANTVDVVVGEYMRCAVRVQMSATGGGNPTNVGRCQAYVTGNWGSTRTLAAILYNASQPAAAQYPQITEPLTLVTPKHILTTRTSLSVLRAHWSGGAKGAATNTYDVERPAFWASAT